MIRHSHYYLYVERYGITAAVSHIERMEIIAFVEFIGCLTTIVADKMVEKTFFLSKKRCSKGRQATHHMGKNIFRAPVSVSLYKGGSFGI